MKRVRILIVVCMITVLGVGCGTTEVTSNAEGDKTLYELAMADSMVAEEDEIYELVTLDALDEMVTWDEEGRVLLLTYHSYPDSYLEGEDVTLEWGSVWSFTDKELEAFYEEEKDDVEDWALRLEQLIGLPEGSGHTVVTAMWVDLSDVTRPAYQSDATDGTMMNYLPEGVEEEYQEWFDQNILDSYYYGAYPWTRLGYTYDWADNGTEYGVTEFLIQKGAITEVEYTMTLDELWDYFDNN
ncbi:MAG: hypothetical protein R3Y67_03325 [Eubacteriales bacterium]